MDSQSILLICIVMSFVPQSEASEPEEKLMKKLFEDHQPMVRPVEYDYQAINVTFNMVLFQLLAINEKEQVMEVAAWIRQHWMDSKLRWNPDDYNGIKEINVRPEVLWVPDIVLYNNIDEANAEFGGNIDTLKTRVKLRNNGEVFWLAPIIIKARCDINVRDFPFDTQQCHMKFGSWTHDMAKLDIHSTSFDITRYQKNLGWNLSKVEIVRNPTEFDGMYYPDITFHLYLQRRSLFHIMNLIFPIALITLLTIVTFILPAESGERLSVAVTLLLATTCFMLLVAEKIPESSESVPLVGIFFMVCMVKIFIIIISLCCISRLYNRTKADVPMGDWTRKYILGLLSYWLGTRCNGKSYVDKHNEANNNNNDSNSYEMALIKNNWLNDHEEDLTLEEEWQIVGKTIDWCLFLFFNILFIIYCAGWFWGVSYVE